MFDDILIIKKLINELIDYGIDFNVRYEIVGKEYTVRMDWDDYLDHDIKTISKYVIQGDI
jgi:hypothetical protein